MASKSKPLLHHASQSWGWICKATAPVRVQNWTAPHGTEARPGPSCHCFKWNSLKLSRKMTMSFPPILCFHRGKGRHNFAATISRDDACHLMPAGAKRKLGTQCKRLRSLRAQLCPAYRECQGAHVIARHVKFACTSMLYLYCLKNRGMQTNPTYKRLLQRPAWKGRDGKVWVGLHNGDLEPLRYDDVTCMPGQASQRLYCEFCIQCFSHVIPVVPHTAVAEVSKIGNL